MKSKRSFIIILGCAVVVVGAGMYYAGSMSANRELSAARQIAQEAMAQSEKLQAQQASSLSAEIDKLKQEVEQIQAAEKKPDAEVADMDTDTETQTAPAESSNEASVPIKMAEQPPAASSSASVPAAQSSQPESTQPEAAPVKAASSSAPKLVQNPDGSYSMTISIDTGRNAEGKRPSSGGGTSREQAEKYVQYLREYAESQGMTWTKDAISGGYEPAMETDGIDMEQFKIDAQGLVADLIRNDRTKLYAKLTESLDIEDEWDITVYR